MISSISAKPWIILEESSNGSGDRKSDLSRLMMTLLERGFPVKLSKLRDGENSEGSQGEGFSVRFEEREPSSTGASEMSLGAIHTGAFNYDELLTAVENAVSAYSDESGRKPWKPWFPVIDYSRCTHCMQCLSFCLFDVYGATSDGKITVQNQDNCKTDCPACSRVCPEVAIMFPKYKAGPINGDTVNSDDVRREGMKVDISALLGGDIYSMLRDRSAKAKSRFSAERDEDRALKERQRCLDKLKSVVGDLEIPAEVLASLPDRDQIETKAKEARQKAQSALDNAAQHRPTTQE